MTHTLWRPNGNRTITTNYTLWSEVSYIYKDNAACKWSFTSFDAEGIFYFCPTSNCHLWTTKTGQHCEFYIKCELHHIINDPLTQADESNMGETPHSPGWAQKASALLNRPQINFWFQAVQSHFYVSPRVQLKMSSNFLQHGHNIWGLVK